MLVLYQAPCRIPEPPLPSDAEAYRAWEHELWNLAQSLDRAANERLHAFDRRKPTAKASSLRKRWRQLRNAHPDAYRSLAAQYLALKSSGAIAGSYTPQSHQWSAIELAQRSASPPDNT